MFLEFDHEFKYSWLSKRLKSIEALAKLGLHTSNGYTHARAAQSYYNKVCDSLYYLRVCIYGLQINMVPRSYDRYS